MVRLVPRQECFFDMFEKQAKMVRHAAHALVDLLTNFEKLEDVAFQLKAAEHDADELAHQIMHKLNTTFVTPLDREDIHALASAMDDIMDEIEVAADRLVIYEIEAPTEASVKLAQILADAAEQTVTAVCGLRDMKQAAVVREACIAVNRLENQGDQINRMALAKLFQMSDRPMEALKWREIQGHIEEAIDKCEDVADIIESTLLKNV
ncbi:MAG: DUF47 domain-containing protein [Armatimonadota bacterium]